MQGWACLLGVSGRKDCCILIFHRGRPTVGAWNAKVISVIEREGAEPTKTVTWTVWMERERWGVSDRGCSRILTKLAEVLILWKASMHKFTTNNKHNTMNKNKKKEEEVVAVIVVVYSRKGVLRCNEESVHWGPVVHLLRHSPASAHSHSGSGLCVCKHCAVFVEKSHPMPE